MDLGKSLREVFQAPIRYMKESLEKESVFEKPYRSGEGYREMHYKPPGPEDPIPKPIKYPDCGTLLAIEYGECDYAVVMWKKDHWSPPLPLGYPDKGTWTIESSSCDGVPCFDYIISYFDSATYGVGQGVLEGGPGVKFKINPDGAIPDPTDPTVGHCHFHITHKTEWDEVCHWEWHIECPLECTEVDLVVLCDVDSIQLGCGSDCDEIAREAAAAVYVGGALGGEPEYPPYKWTISGTGFHFDAVDGPTTGETATAATTILIYADATACGTGTVTVTDACGNTGTDYIRCSEGQWVEIGTGCVYPGEHDGYWNDGAGYPDTKFYFYKIVGKHKQETKYGCAYSVSHSQYAYTCDSCAGKCSDATECVLLDCATINSLVPTKCSNGYDCITCLGDGDGAGHYKNLNCFYYVGDKLYEWQCIP